MVLNQTQGDVERLMRDGQAAAKRGDKVMARALLTQLLELNPHNEQAWMWLSGAVDDKDEQRTCLENVLILNPNNAQARKGLNFLQGKVSTAEPPKPTAMLDVTTQAPPAEMPYPDAPVMEQAPVHAPTEPSTFPAASGTLVLGGTRGEMDLTPFPVPGAGDQPFDPSQLETPSSSAFSDFGSGGLNSSSTPGAQGQTGAHEVPDWVSSLTGGGSAPAFAQSPSQAAPTFPEPVATQLLQEHSEQGTGDHGAEAALQPAPQSAGATAPGNGVDLNAWLEELQSAAKPFDFTESQDTSGLNNGFTQAHEPISHDGAYEHDPLAGGHSAFEAGMAAGAGFDGLMGVAGDAGAGAPSASFDPMDPFFGAQLPTPDELPGGGADEPDDTQPWYLRSSNQSSHASSSFEEPYGIGYPTDDHPAQSHQMVPPTPVVMVPCPNCRTEVPDTSLQCPQCRYSFFVHCPHCHELIDTTNARDGVVEGCPYCGAQVNRMDLGRSGATGVVRPLSAPKETKLEWTGEADDAPKRRSLAVTFGWLIDLMWLMVIVLMVWALTQLPIWLHLTDLYN